MLRKVTILLVVLLAFPLASQAADDSGPDMTSTQQEAETTIWRWPEAGISFEYPSDWTFQRADNFEFVLQSSGEVPRGMGMQLFPLEEGDTLVSVFDDFATEIGAELEEIEVGGVDAVRVQLPEDAGRQSVMVAYLHAEEGIALMSFSGLVEDWDVFSGQIDQILGTASISTLSLDVELLNQQMQVNFEEGEVLSVGEADADVRIVEVIDFSCPHCANYSPSINRVIHDYVAPGDLKIEFYTVTWVGDELSETAASAQYCAASLGFGWDVHELLFDLQRTEGRDFFSNENLIEAVTGLDADTEGFAECMESGQFKALIERDLKIAEDYDAQGTPAVLVSESDAEPAHVLNSAGEPYRGGVPLLLLYNQIDTLLASNQEF